jgi:hypothetical protein
MACKSLLLGMVLSSKRRIVQVVGVVWVVVQMLVRQREQQTGKGEAWRCWMVGRVRH